MAAPSPLDARSRHSFPARSLSQRSDARRSNPDVFSDEYALGTIDSPTEAHALLPSDSNEEIAHPPSLHTTSATTLIHPERRDSEHVAELPRSSISKRWSSHRNNGQSAAVDRNQSTVSRASAATARTHRTTSSASRFSIPRAPSPYNGATGPSHPYQMYPQMTRASSVSTSTIRPREGSYHGASRPEHPYGMYPQNTVDDEVADGIGNGAIPLGFPGMGQNYHRQMGTAGDDVADVIGPDGHVEQLPPYSRYADDMPRKRDIAVAENPASASSSNVDSSSSSTAPEPLSTGMYHDAPSPSSERSERSDRSENPTSTKEVWHRSNRRRVCCGLPLRAMLAILGLILLSGIIGGIIGGVVGHDGHHKHNHDKSPFPDTAASTTVVTATSWIDATPIPTIVTDIPQGSFAIPIGQTLTSTSQCVDQKSLSVVWACMAPTVIDVNIGVEDTSGTKQISFNSFTPTVNISYGPQVPDLGTEPIMMAPSLDKSAKNLGPSFFFQKSFNKLVILAQLPGYPGGGSRRSIPENEILARDTSFGRKQRAQPGSQPWFCFWNNTLLEFFLFVNQTTAAANGSASTMSNYMPTTTASGFSTGPTSAFPTAAPTTTPYAQLAERDGGHSANPPYPRFVKLQEKRIAGSLPPYCQQMQILDDGTWNPVPGVEPVVVDENEPPPPTTAKGASKRWDHGYAPAAHELWPRQSPSAPLNSFCCCEWMAT